MVSEIRFGKLRFCRICGKQGVKFASDGCKYCGSPWIDDITWQIKRKEGLTEVIDGVEVLKKESSKEVLKENINYVVKKTLFGISGLSIGILIIFLIISIYAIIYGFIIPFYFLD
mgnify:CR=1 FL=1